MGCNSTGTSGISITYGVDFAVCGGVQVGNGCRRESQGAAHPQAAAAVPDQLEDGVAQQALAGRDPGGLAVLQDADAERLGLVAMIDITHPDFVLAGARDDEVAPADRPG